MKFLYKNVKNKYLILGRLLNSSSVVKDYFIFKIAGYLNINDIDFKRIKAGISQSTFSEPILHYQILGVDKQTDIAEIRTVYRKLVLQYHPDRNNHLSEAEKKKLALKLQQVKEAYEKIKQERKHV
jgi:DnaJ-class molecular chaperone